VIYGVLVYADEQMENFAIQEMIVAAAIGTAFELGFRKLPGIRTYIDKTQHPRAAVPLKVAQSVIGYSTGKATETLYRYTRGKEKLSRVLPESGAHGGKAFGKSLVRNVPPLVHLYFFTFPQLDNFLPSLCLSIVGEAFGTSLKNHIQENGQEWLNTAKSITASGVARFLANSGGELVVGWKQDPYVGIFSELVVGGTKYSFDKVIKLIKMWIDQEDILEIFEFPQSLELLKTYNFTLSKGGLQILPSYFLAPEERYISFEPDPNFSFLRSHSVIRTCDDTDSREDSSVDAKYVLEAEQRGNGEMPVKCNYRTFMLLWDTNTSQLISEHKGFELAL
jgi:hypothetical protein